MVESLDCYLTSEEYDTVLDDLFLSSLLNNIDAVAEVLDSLHPDDRAALIGSLAARRLSILEVQRQAFGSNFTSQVSENISLKR